MGEHWSVSIERNGENVVTIESNCLSGRVISNEDERVIRLAADHLLSFVGHKESAASEPASDECLQCGSKLANCECPEPETAYRALKSISAMLGWMNLPPRTTLEAEIRAMKSRLRAVQTSAQDR